MAVVGSHGAGALDLRTTRWKWQEYCSGSWTLLDTKRTGHVCLRLAGPGPKKVGSPGGQEIGQANNKVTFPREEESKSPALAERHEHPPLGFAAASASSPVLVLTRRMMGTPLRQLRQGACCE